MPSTEAPLSRDKERTRRAILDAAEMQLARHGSGASIAEIAGAAGVSKSGLLHHFPSKDELMEALALDCIGRFRNAIMAAVDISENRPGKVLRAYVRVLCDGHSEAAKLFVAVPWMALSSIQGVSEYFEEDDLRWQAELIADGIHPVQATIVRFAAERFTESNFANFAPATDNQASIRAKLLEMSEPGWYAE